MSVKRKRSGEAEAESEPPKQPRKTKTCQVFEEEVYWASVVATLRKSTIAKIFSPLIRDELRRMVKEHGVDPDEAWRSASAVGDDE